MPSIVGADLRDVVKQAFIHEGAVTVKLIVVSDLDRFPTYSALAS